MAINSTVTKDREQSKFVESPTRSGQPAVEVVPSDVVLIQKIDEVSASVIYVGQAVPGSLTSAAVWKIKKISVSGVVTTISFADSNALFDNIWDDRASLSYS